MATKYNLFFKRSRELLEAVDDSDPRLTHPDAMKNLLQSVWTHALNEGASPIEVRVGTTVATDLMAELVTEWYPGPEVAELCRVYSDFLVRFDPALGADEVIVY